MANNKDSPTCSAYFFFCASGRKTPGLSLYSAGSRGVAVPPVEKQEPLIEAFPRLFLYFLDQATPETLSCFSEINLPFVFFFLIYFFVF